MDTGIYRYRGTEMYMDTVIQGYRDKWIQEYRDTWIQEGKN